MEREPVSARSYTASREHPILHVSYAESLADALFAAAEVVKREEPHSIAFDITVYPPFSFDSGPDWTVNVYQIHQDE